MAATKKYADVEYYERKLKNVMDRFEASEYDYDWNRTGCWVEFTYHGQRYRFEHSVASAREHGVNIHYGSDAFAQVVLALEDLARIVSRGIYDLSYWVAGMKALPKYTEIPSYISFLGFTRIPETVEEVDKAYRQKAKILHPDAGGSNDEFAVLQDAYAAARKYVEQKVQKK